MLSPLRPSGIASGHRGHRAGASASSGPVRDTVGRSDTHRPFTVLDISLSLLASLHHWPCFSGLLLFINRHSIGVYHRALHYRSGSTATASLAIRHSSASLQGVRPPATSGQDRWPLPPPITDRYSPGPAPLAAAGLPGIRRPVGSLTVRRLPQAWPPAAWDLPPGLHRLRLLASFYIRLGLGRINSFNFFFLSDTSGFIHILPFWPFNQVSLAWRRSSALHQYY